ncbi:Copper amine oxidase N-terminal domain-containing protein [Anaerosphaera aminiphila DSM 21120]|uniref:Copper amine oxidase N-terminal domain-containing protein n=1 Tax=Anaerosphaera aminiphila DSM 21120 TaxID=1120995 RepID=A0A1M5UY17_9FIRM|nr:copper amine oxidase N-terminal domain-containing protein [Anaerosphaera aminiphila]SHH67806.1 Copper amine oxidase N-terminal domain-containing protein [Anaerosphaera aminiphila DSM 21120]
MFKKLLIIPMLIVALLPVNAFAETEAQTLKDQYTIHNGTVQAISSSQKTADENKDTDNKNNEDQFSEILFEYSEGDATNKIRLSISKDTLIVNANTLEKIKSVDEITVGNKISVAYPSLTPMAMSNPPMLSPKLIVVQSETPLNIKIDKFDNSLISSDNMLKLNISDNVKTIDVSGEKVSIEDNYNKIAAVLYGVSTRSIPAQTNPDMIIVLEDSLSGELNISEVKIKDKNLILKNNIINNDVPLLPLREISENLNFKLTWNEADKSIKIEKDGTVISTIVDNSYKENSESTIAKPQRNKGVTYVPVEFFRDMLNVNVTLTDGIYNFN